MQRSRNRTMCIFRGLPHRALVAGLIALLINGCAPSSSSPQEAPLETRTCSSSRQCVLGDFCDDGQCVPFEAGGCEELHCQDIASLCLANPAGCECHILNEGGNFNTTGTPQLHFKSGQQRGLQAQIALSGGDVLDTTGFTLSVNDPRLFSTEEATVSALDAVGRTRVQATFGELATCEATLINHGSAPERNEVRLLAYDPTTGEAVSDAHVVIRFSASAQPGAFHPHQRTNREGLATLELDDGDLAQVSVFHQGYDYVSVLGISNDSPMIRVPLPPRGRGRTVGAARGDLGFEPHIKRLDPHSGSIRLGIVSTSFPLTDLEHFGPETFLGGPILGRDCETEPANPECYDLSLPGVIDKHVALWGGLVVSLPTTPLKPFYEVTGQPGRRYLWSLGGFWDVNSAAGVFQAIAQRTEGACPDCPTSSDASMLRSISKLMGSASFGYRSNVLLQPAPLNDWVQHLRSDDFLDKRFPQLDSGDDLSGLTLSRPMRQFTQVPVPELPADPTLSNNQGFAGFAVLTGAQAPGAGFVPMGMGLGFDCTYGSCNQGAPRAAYDGVVNPEPICTDNATLACENNTNSVTEAGTVGIFHQPFPGALASSPQKTLLMALPLDHADPYTFRVRALIAEGAPDEIGATFSDQVFTESAPTLASQAQRTYEIIPTAHTDVHHVVLRVESTDTSLPSPPRWHIYSPNQALTFSAPNAPRDWYDPWDVSEGLQITHATTRLKDSLTFDDLAAGQQGALHRVLESAEAFSSMTEPQ